LTRLIIVDDDLDMLAMLRDLLQERHEVITTTPGEAAVEHFARQRPDAVFLDIAMPGLNGVEVLKVLIGIDASVPVVMATANAETLVVEDCLKSGAFAWVLKPFDLAYMDHIAATATEQKSPRD